MEKFSSSQALTDECIQQAHVPVSCLINPWVCTPTGAHAALLLQVETAGDCYIAAGGLTKVDADGFMCLDPSPDPVDSAQRVISFAKVGVAVLFKQHIWDAQSC